MSFKYWIYAIYVVSSLQTYANASFSMASWVDNMIISIASYDANTCGDGVNNISFFLCFGCKHKIYTICSRPNPSPLQRWPHNPLYPSTCVRCGLSNLLQWLNIVGIDCLPMDFNFHPLVFRRTMWDMDAISWTCECEHEQFSLKYSFDINKIFEEYDLRCYSIRW